MTYTTEYESKSETPAQSHQVIQVQIDQQVFQLPIHENSVIKICIGQPDKGNRTTECKLPPKFQALAQRYSNEVEALAAKGFVNQRLVLRLLHKCGGNVDQVEQILLKKRPRGCKRSQGCKRMKDAQRNHPCPAKFEELNQRYSNEVEALAAKGFNPRLVLRLLHKCDGDVERVEQLLANPRQCWKEMKGKRMRPSVPRDTQEDSQRYSAEMEGKVDQVEQILLKHRQKQQCEKHGLQDSAQRYANEIEILSSKGFSNARLVARLLNKCDGDVEQVEQILFRKQQKLPKASRIQELTQRYSSEVEVLAAKGFENTTLVVRLLNKCEGNVAQVEQILARKRQGAKHHDLYPEALTQLAQRGYLNPRKNFIALRKSDGDVEKASAWLARNSC